MDRECIRKDTGQTSKITYQNRWKNSSVQQSSPNRLEELQSVKDLLDLCDDEETIFSEQEAGKATVYSPIQNKKSMEAETEKYEEELLGKSAEIRAQIGNLFGR